MQNTQLVLNVVKNYNKLNKNEQKLMLKTIKEYNDYINYITDDEYLALALYSAILQSNGINKEFNEIEQTIEFTLFRDELFNIIYK